MPLHPHNQRFHEIKKLAEMLQKSLYDYISETGTKIKAQQLFLDAATANSDMVDAAIIAKDIEELADEIRKDAKSRAEAIGTVLAQAWAEKRLKAAPSPHAVQSEDVIEGQLGFGTPQVGITATLPKPDTAEWVAFMMHLKVPQELWHDFDKRKDMPVKVSWEGLANYCTKLTQEGKPLPPGILKTYPKFATSFRRKSARQMK